MATTSIWKIEQRLDKVINYTVNINKTKNENFGIKQDVLYQDLHNVLDYTMSDYKTEKQFFVTGINCDEEDACTQMLITKKSWHKEKNRIMAYHGFQSFKSGEVTPQIAHEIGVKLAQELWGDRFEVVVSTHLNTNCYHNHFVINSVSFVDGKMFYNNFKTYSMMRHISDSLCDEYGLSTLKEKKCGKYNVNYNDVYQKYARANNYQNTTKRDMDFAIGQAFSFEDFKSIMKKLDYEIIFRSGKISVRHKNYKRNIRIERAFGEDYSIENIKKRIIEEEATRIPFIEVYKLKGTSKSFKGVYKKNKKKSKGFIALYYHYCYLLKVFPNTKNVNKKLPASIRADVKLMEQYSQQAIFLNENKLDTKEDLEKYKEQTTCILNERLSKRESLWRYRKLEENSNKQKQICNNISIINLEIKDLRKKIRLIEDIESRIPKMKENIQEMKKEEQDRKEKIKDEYIK